MTLAQRFRLAPRARPQPWHLGTGTPPEGPFVALVPGEDAPLLPLDLPAALRGRERARVAQRQLADMLGLGPAGFEMRPAMLGADRANWARALVAGRERAGDWRAALARLPRAPVALLPDYLALPAAPGVWVLAADAGRLRARLGPEDGFSCEMALAPALLRQALATAPAPPVVHWQGPPDPALAAFCTEHRLARAERLDAQPLAQGELGLDLAQDAIAEAEALRRALAPWRLPAAMAVLALALWSGATLYATHTAETVAAAHRARAEALARQGPIPSGPILDLRRQVAQALATLDRAQEPATDIPPLDLLRRAAPLLADGPVAVASAAYRPGTGLLVDLDAPDFAALDALVASLRAEGLLARIAQSAAGEAGGVRATLGLPSGPEAGQ